jgi:predicted Zn-dependent protease
MTIQQGVALGGAVLGGVAQGQLSEGAMNAVKLAYGVGSQVAVLPHSRFQESEADRIGLRYSARAGYDPRAALTFWQKMNQQAQASGMPSFLRTHPSGEDRMKVLQEEMPQVLPIYEAALRGGGVGPEIGRDPIGREIGR